MTSDVKYTVEMLQKNMITQLLFDLILRFIFSVLCFMLFVLSYTFSEAVWYNMTMNPNEVKRFRFGTGIIEEMKKVTWPTKQQTIRLTTIVIVTSLIIGLYIGIMDILLAKGLTALTELR